MRPITVWLATLLASFAPTLAAAQECPDILQHDMRKLRSDVSVDLCSQYRGKALLIVNTASACGFTPQFKGLEALYQQYRNQGLAVLGFPSDDFHQEADDEAETAKVCYVNYGVSFDMFAPIHVTGEDAHPLFRQLAASQGAPKWNFYKYVVDPDGNVVAAFSSMVKPDSAKLGAAIESALPK